MCLLFIETGFICSLLQFFIRVLMDYHFGMSRLRHLEVNTNTAILLDLFVTLSSFSIIFLCESWRLLDRSCVVGKVTSTIWSLIDCDISVGRGCDYYRWLLYCLLLSFLIHGVH